MRINVLTAVLALNLVLAGGLAWLWSDPQRYRWVEPEALPPALDEVAAAEAAEPAEVSRYRETLERPLFVASRRIGPRKDRAAEGQDGADTLNDVRLLGTYLAGGQGGIIVSRGGKVERMPVGASIGPWKVAGEAGRGAALERANGERRTLELTLNTAPPAAAAAKEAATPDAAAAPGQSRSSVDARPAAPRAASTDTAAASGRARPQQLERINARRAQRGLPPITQ